MAGAAGDVVPAVAYRCKQQMTQPLVAGRLARRWHRLARIAAQTDFLGCMAALDSRGWLQTPKSKSSRKRSQGQKNRRMGKPPPCLAEGGGTRTHMNESKGRPTWELLVDGPPPPLAPRTHAAGAFAACRHCLLRGWKWQSGLACSPPPLGDGPTQRCQSFQLQLRDGCCDQGAGCQWAAPGKDP